MKKLITILFIMLVSIPAFSLEFDSTTDQCIRTILDKQEGEITTEDLVNIDEFYCYSSEVTLESLIELVKNLKDKTVITIGEEGKDGYVEGITSEGNFLAGTTSEDEKIALGIWNKDTFIPGYLDLKNKIFLPGVIFEDVFTSGIILDSKFLAGIFDVEKETFAKGLLEIGKDDKISFTSGDFGSNYDTFNDLLKGDKKFGMSRDDLMSLSGLNNGNYENTGKINQSSLFISLEEIGEVIWDTGVTMGVASFLTSAFTGAGAWIITGELTGKGGAIAIASGAGASVAVGTGIGLIIGIVGYVAYDYFTNDESGEVENYENKGDDQNSEENKKDDTKCEDPNAEPKGDSPNDDDDDDDDDVKQDPIINTGVEGEVKVDIQNKKENSKVTQDSIINTGAEGIDTGIIIDGIVDQGVIINTGNPNLETQ